MGEQISFSGLINVLIKKWWILVASAIVVGVAGYFMGVILSGEAYKSSGSFVVHVEETSDGSTDAGRINATQKLINTYLEIMRTNTFLTRVSVTSGLSYTPEQINKMLSYASINNTSIISVSALSVNPVHARIVTQSVLVGIKEELERIGLPGKAIILDEAGAPVKATRVGYTYYMLMGILIGLLAGLFVLLVLEFFDTRVKRLEDLKQRYTLPILGIIPEAEKKETISSDTKGEPKGEFESYVINKKTPLAIREAYNALKRGIQDKTEHTVSAKAILIAGSVPEEGEAACALNLATVLANTGARVIVVDCDFRKPKVHTIIGIGNKKGFSEALSEKSDISDFIIKHTKLDIDVVTAGNAPCDPRDVFASGPFSKAIVALREKYDYLLAVGPPINVGPELMSIAGAVDGIAITVRHGYTAHNMLNKAVDTLQNANINILGFVLNDVDTGYYEKNIALGGDIIRFKEYYYN